MGWEDVFRQTGEIQIEGLQFEACDPNHDGNLDICFAGKSISEVTEDDLDSTVSIHIVEELREQVDAADLDLEEAYQARLARMNEPFDPGPWTGLAEQLPEIAEAQSYMLEGIKPSDLEQAIAYLQENLALCGTQKLEQCNIRNPKQVGAKRMGIGAQRAVTRLSSALTHWVQGQLPDYCSERASALGIEPELIADEYGQVYVKNLDGDFLQQMGDADAMCNVSQIYQSDEFARHLVNQPTPYGAEQRWRIHRMLIDSSADDEMEGEWWTRPYRETVQRNLAPEGLSEEEQLELHMSDLLFVLPHPPFVSEGYAISGGISSTIDSQLLAFTRPERGELLTYSAEQRRYTLTPKAQELYNKKESQLDEYWDRSLQAIREDLERLAQDYLEGGELGEQFLEEQISNYIVTAWARGMSGRVQDSLPANVLQAQTLLREQKPE